MTKKLLLKNLSKSRVAKDEEFFCVCVCVCVFACVCRALLIGENFVCV